MLGNRIETRISSRFRRILPSLILILHFAVCLKAFAPTNIFCPSLTSSGYCIPLEAFLPIDKRTQRSCVAFLQSKRIAPSPSSTLILEMASNNENNVGNRSQTQRQKDPRRREATTNAAPMYITIGKNLHLLFKIFQKDLLCDDRKSSRMIKSPHCEMRFRCSERSDELDLGCCK